MCISFSLKTLHRENLKVNLQENTVSFKRYQQNSKQFIQDCAPGFTRFDAGIYLGLCHLCQCNGHADLCDADTGSCFVSNLLLDNFDREILEDLV